jgi:hypothetical protein
MARSMPTAKAITENATTMSSQIDCSMREVPWFGDSTAEQEAGR